MVFTDPPSSFLEANFQSCTRSTADLNTDFVTSDTMNLCVTQMTMNSAARLITDRAIRTWPDFSGYKTKKQVSDH